METFLTVSVISLWVFVAILLVVMFLTLKLIIEFLNRYPVDQAIAAKLPLSVGQHAPKFHGVDQHGNLFSLEDNEEKKTLLLFTTQDCAMCAQIVADLPNLSVDRNQLRVVVIEQILNPDIPVKQVHPSITYLQNDDVFYRYNVKKVPAIALVDAYGFLADLDFISSFRELDLRIQKYLKKVS